MIMIPCYSYYFNDFSVISEQLGAFLACHGYDGMTMQVYAKHPDYCEFMVNEILANEDGQAAELVLLVLPCVIDFPRAYN